MCPQITDVDTLDEKLHPSRQAAGFSVLGLLLSDPSSAAKGEKQMNTNNNQPIPAALPELEVIGNLVYENYDASRLVDATVGMVYASTGLSF